MASVTVQASNMTLKKKEIVTDEPTKFLQSKQRSITMSSSQALENKTVILSEKISDPTVMHCDRFEFPLTIVFSVDSF